MLKGHTIYIRPLETEDAEENLRLQEKTGHFLNSSS